MATIAIYSAKGGVGKTMLAVNLAWAAATRSARRTLLWDLDAQAASTLILARARGAVAAIEVIERDVAPDRAIVPTAVPRLALLPADRTLRGLDAAFDRLDRKRRLARLIAELSGSHERVLLDCPPGLGPVADQIIRAADLIVLPVPPSPLAQRAYQDVREHLAQRHKGRVRVLPVFTMVDRRRTAHRAAIAAQPDWPVVPAAALVEQMAVKRAAVADYAPRSAVAAAIDAIWIEVERALAR